MGNGGFKGENNISNGNALNVQINLKIETIHVCQFSQLKGSNDIMDRRKQMYARVSIYFLKGHG